MDFQHRAAAWLTSYVMTNEHLRAAAKQVESVPFVTQCIVAFGPSLLGEHAQPLTEILEAAHQSQALEPALGQLEDALGEPEAEQAMDEQARVDQQARDEQARVDQQARDEQARVDQQARDEQARVDQQARDEQARIDQQARDEQARVDQQARDEQARIDQQAKDEHVKADAELAAAVIEEQTGILEQQIADEAEKSAEEIDSLKKDFEREQQELTGKLDGMASNYFDKHPDLSDDQRRDATATFNGIKEEALGELRGNQETRLGELTRTQQEQRGELEERKKELDDTRSDR